MVKNPKWPKHRANKNRTEESDIDRVTNLQSCFPKEYHPLRYQTLILPHGKYGQRRPDLTIKMSGYTIPVEHDGGIHGFNDEDSETYKTKERNDDFVRDGHTPIIVNYEQLAEEQISEELFVRCAMILLEPIYRAKARLLL